jgi:hypothetical protein
MASLAILGDFNNPRFKIHMFTDHSQPSFVWRFCLHDLQNYYFTNLLNPKWGACPSSLCSQKVMLLGFSMLLLSFLPLSSPIIADPCSRSLPSVLLLKIT